MASLFEQHFRRGQDALDERDPVEALEAFDAALALASDATEHALALDGAANAHYLQHNDDRALSLLDEAAGLCLPRDGDLALDSPAAHALARILYDKGGMLGQMKRGTDAFGVLDDMIKRFTDWATTVAPRDELAFNARLVVVLAMRLKAELLAKLDEKRAAAEAYGEIFHLFQHVDRDGQVMRNTARSMIDCGLLLGEMGRDDEEIAAYDAVVARYGEIHLVPLSHVVIKALENKALTYRDQEDHEAVVATCDDLIRRYEFNPGQGIADRVGRAMIRKANALNKLGKTAQELACYDHAVMRYAHWPEPEIRKHAAIALISKAVTLNDADQTADEMECYEEVIRRYAEDEADELRALAAQALVYKGLSLRGIAEDAAEDTGVIETEAEIACYDRVIDRYGGEDHIEIQRVVAEALLRKGEILLETGATAAAAACCDALIDGFAGIKDEDIAETVEEARGMRAEC
jgi:tetratricopeptide (TPR) repeat protein